MTDKLILELIAKRVDSETLYLMAQVDEFRDTIQGSIEDQYSWYERIRTVLQYRIEWDKDTNWHQVYNILENAENVNPFSDNGALSKPENGYNLTAVRFLLDLGYNPDTGNATLIYAGMYGTIGVIRLLLEDERIASRFNPADYVLRGAASANRPGIVRELLSSYRIASVIDALELASSRGYDKTVQELLSFDKLMVEAVRKAIIAAITNNKPSTLSLLLADKRSNPSYYEEIMEKAATASFEIVRILLDDKRAAVTKKSVLLAATKNNDTRVLELLLARLRETRQVDIAFVRQLFNLVCKEGSASNADLLLNDSEVNVEAYDSAAFRHAVEGRNIEVVKLLLEDGRSDPAAKDNAALKEAIASYNTRLISTLLDDERVDEYGEQVCRFLLDPSSMNGSEVVITNLLMSNYRAFQHVPRYIVDYARSNITSKGHYDRLLREVLIMRLAIGDYCRWLRELQNDPTISMPSKILVKNAAASVAYNRRAIHKSEYFTAYRGFFMSGIDIRTDTGLARPNAALIVEILSSEEGVTDAGIRRAKMLLYALEAAQK